MRSKKNLSSFYSAILLCTLLFIRNPLYSQANTTQPDSINKRRLNTVIISYSVAYTATLGVLYFGWYKDNPSSSFHFIDDSQNWLQMDKLGHVTAAYTFTNYGYWMLRWAGVNNKKSALFSSLMGFGSMTVIEILDGFSAEYGASASDLLANALGAGLSLSQNLLWQEQRISLKFSYHPTEYAQYYPSQLGETPLQRVLKDYNGQTYWFSTSIGSFLKNESKFPRWICISAGYGADGMLAPLSNPEFNSDGNPLPEFERFRQYYLSMDVDLTKIKTNSQTLRILFRTLSFVKIPFPAIEYNNQNQFVWHWIYF